MALFWVQSLGAPELDLEVRGPVGSRVAGAWTPDWTGLLAPPPPPAAQ